MRSTARTKRRQCRVLPSWIQPAYSYTESLTPVMQTRQSHAVVISRSRRQLAISHIHQHWQFFNCSQQINAKIHISADIFHRMAYKPLLSTFYAPDRRKGDNKRCFCPSVCPSVAYIANNSRTQRPSVPKFGRKVPHLRCDSHTSFKVKRPKVRVRGGRGHTVSAELGGHSAC